MRDPVEHHSDSGSWPPPPRALLLDFLASFAESCFAFPDEPLDEVANPPGHEAEIARYEAGEWDSDEDVIGSAEIVVAEALYARWTLAARAVCPGLVDPVMPLLADPQLAVRIRAANCLVKLCRHPEVQPRRAELAELIERAARVAPTQERATLILSLGDLGADTTPFLADPDQAVRCCAALTPSQRANPAATREILAALEDPAVADHWLPRYAPQVRGWLRFTLVREAIQRTASFEDLLPAALAVASGPASAMTVESDWGPLLAAAFPTPPSGTLSPAQRAYLAALIANEQLWDPQHGNAHLWFKNLGLTYDRASCRALLREGA